ncbi:alpha/beta hydrolase family protein [Sphingomonas baiyangensis]|uniref:S9 family peptidase n=1 Tax=Sphingomonas baiyangensis TaxID=2572576 RepID=A0A4U1L0R9_9SPHN|nr:S9 family peptidase [Sphingomonas baiyangensis]TKD50351.1 S9 family peptidase [Sphingomonas baiyangensis]
MRLVGGASLLALAMVAGTPAASAQQGDRLAAAFGARPAVQQASLSPDGTKVAYIAPTGGQGNALVVLDLSGGGLATPKPVARADGAPDRLSDCHWTSNQRLLCTIYAVTRIETGITYVSRKVAVDADGGNARILHLQRGTGEKLGYALSGGSVIDWAPGDEGHVLMARPYVPERATGTRLAQTRAGLGVDLVNTLTLQFSTRERPDDLAVEFITDGHGVVRIKGQGERDASGYATGRTLYLHRAPGESTWRRISIVDRDEAGFNPYGVDRERNLAYGLKRVDGRLAAYTKTLDAAGTETLLFSHPDVDVAGFMRMGRRGRIVGVQYVTDHSEVEYLDPVLKRLSASLSKALPDAPLVRFVDSSEDENILLLWAGSDDDPGRYYILDRKGGAMSELMLERPALENRSLATMQAITYRAADGTMIPGYLSLPPGKTSAKGLPALVMPHGGPGARDEWGFDWLVQYFAAKGYAVLQPNFRGSTGYGDAWFQKNGFQGWRTAIGDVNDAGRWLVSQGADAGRLGVFGWSYGGYAALQSGVTEPGLFKAIVAVAPVTDLDRLREESRYWSNYRMVRDFIGTGEHVSSGSPARHAAKFAAPVLMFHGDLDRNVGIAQARLMHSRLQAAGKRSELIEYDKLDHYLEDSAARTDMLSRSAAFLDAALGK